jgi:hypothetical protein
VDIQNIPRTIKFKKHKKFVELISLFCWMDLGIFFMVLLLDETKSTLDSFDLLFAG